MPNVPPGPRPFRFGVLAAGAVDAQGWRRTARLVESLGYSSLLFPDHQDKDWGPLVSLAVAAEHTSHLRLGTLMLAAGLRSVPLLYKEMATLDIVSGGRTEVGLGAGWYVQDYLRAGVKMAPPRERIDLLEESAEVFTRLWEESAASLRGRHLQIDGAVGRPQPVQDKAPLTIGGGGERVLGVAARHASIINIGAVLSSGGKDTRFGASATADRFDERVRLIRELTAACVSPPELQCLAFAAAVTEQRDRYARRVLSPMFGLPPEEALESPLAVVGSVEQICDTLLERRERFGITYWVIPANQAEVFAPVVARLTSAERSSALMGVE
ncbi:TIGR03621 family F420-dependent LLM class oxidoreductase [Nocardiopsis sp. HNM0947]|uniref:TIGR03621 family F420-dependent LLM class oxidoreductase n=1 Tax=Nocardiopsis coralli TaxID=2772213 RepID=A0ABR9P078_9ACTN|nr:TIGR03621 family F420-dependent LLM class oxidoreductase [Nocardiopsis coralli]MBE2997225.1 TIGR03621 family F420-dependent LLM class oxidoreductase [Nocardiopsis coralli]